MSLKNRPLVPREYKKACMHDIMSANLNTRFNVFERSLLFDMYYSRDVIVNTLEINFIYI
jgi:hypothetical protein